MLYWIIYSLLYVNVNIVNKSMSIFVCFMFLNVSKLVSLIIIHKSKIINYLVNCRHLHDIITNFSLRLLADKAINRGLRNWIANRII